MRAAPPQARLLREAAQAVLPAQVPAVQVPGRRVCQRHYRWPAAELQVLQARQGLWLLPARRVRVSGQHRSLYRVRVRVRTGSRVPALVLPQALQVQEAPLDDDSLIALGPNSRQ